MKRELGWAALLCGLAATLFLGSALFTGRLLSPAGMLFGFEPWRDQPPTAAFTSNSSLYDLPTQNEPWLIYSAERLHAGSLPLWNPYNMLGIPLIGNDQSAVFDPLNWPFFVWPDGHMLVLRAWLRLFIGALGMYGLARQVFRVGPAAAGVAAAAFGYGASLTTWLLWPLACVIAWLPWLWWASSRLVAQPSPRRAAGVAVVTALTVFAGHPETAYHVAVTTAAFVLFQAWQSAPPRWAARGRRVSVWLAAYGLGIVVAAIQVLPFGEALLQSAVLAGRAGAAADKGIVFAYAWTLISPDWFGNPAHATWWGPGSTYEDANAFVGVLPLLLAPLALLVQDRAQRRQALFLLTLCGLALGLIFHAPVLYPVLTAVVPLLGTVLNNRLLFVVELGLGLLAALGVEALWQRLPQERARLARWLVAALLILLLVGVGVPWLWAQPYFHLPATAPTEAEWQTSLLRAPALLAISGVLLGGVILIRAARPRLARALVALLPLIVFADLWQAHGDFTPTVAPQDYFPAQPVTRFLQEQPGPGRLMAASHTLLQNTNLMYGLADLRGYDAIEPKLYHELAAGMEPVLTHTRGGEWHDFSGVASPLWDLLNARYILAAPDADPNYRVDVRQDAVTGDYVGEILGARQPGQTFVAGQDSLAGIQVLGGTFGGRSAGRLIFHLKSDPAAPGDLATRTLDAAQLPDDAYWTITFPPVRAARGQTFYFSFTAPDAQPGHAASLWYSRTDAYPPGTRMSNGQPADGDLVFRSLAPTSPDANWFKRVFDGGATASSVFENAQALPRAWLVHRVVVEPDGAAQVQRLADPAFAPAGTAVLAAPLPAADGLPSVPPPTSADAITITYYAPESVEITTQSTAPALLILADQFYPGWEAQSDGQPVPILPVDHALRGVYLPAGVHVVRFTYAPLPFRIGAVLTGGGLSVLALLLVWPRAAQYMAHRRRHAKLS